MEERDVDLFFLFYNIMDIPVTAYTVYQYCLTGCAGARERHTNTVSCAPVNSTCSSTGGPS